MGGALTAIERGFPQREIEEAAYAFERQVEAGERVVVGVNRFAEDAEEEMELHRLDPEAERRQVERTQRVRAERDAAAVEAALGLVREAASGETNLLVPIREALAVHATVGEVCDALRDEFGTHDAHLAP